jgi:O-antigen ligase
VEELEVATRKPHSAHSIYFAVLGDHGFPGLAFFVALLISCFLSIRALRREARDRPEMAWVLPYCAMIQVSLMAYAISGAFLTQSYFDLFYHLVAFVIVLKAIVVRERLEPVVPSPSPVGIPAGATA